MKTHQDTQKDGDGLTQPVSPHFSGEDAPFFLAGHRVPAGTYRLVSTGQEVRLDQDDVLPATCDGQVAVYVRQPITWAEIE